MRGSAVRAMSADVVTHMLGSFPICARGWHGCSAAAACRYVLLARSTLIPGEPGVIVPITRARTPPAPPGPQLDCTTSDVAQHSAKWTASRCCSARAQVCGCSASLAHLSKGAGLVQEPRRSAVRLVEHEPGTAQMKILTSARQSLTKSGRGCGWAEAWVGVAGRYPTK